MDVFVVDRHGKPLMPCHPARARQLLRQRRAVIHRHVPLVIRLKDRRWEECSVQPVRVKLDPGSKTTGVAIVRESNAVDPDTGEVQRQTTVLALIELVHRGRQISEALTARRQMRRRRRRSLRYRAPRFLNRSKPKGWLAPSLQHRVDTTMAWVTRLSRWAPVTALSSELVRFDMQQMQNPEIEGVEYQQGTLAGYEVREYLLEKWGRKCVYCDAAQTPLQIEHLQPRARSGSNRISNLALACGPCNLKKAAQPLDAFLAKDPLRLARIQAQAQRPLRDAAAVNATRWALAGTLKGTGLPLELASGGRTKYNRSRFEIPKTHALDAACVGDVDEVTKWQQPTLQVNCTGRGSYQRTRLDKYGFPRGYLMRQKSIKGFQTGDRVRAVVPASSKKAGMYTGRVAVRASGSFNIQTGSEVVQGISYKYCRLIQRGDGYSYTRIASLKGVAGTGHVNHAALSLPALKGEVSRAK
ncbi:MAG: HNH endonuclease [Alcaligenaceae bacterium]|nr:HNH endonuclease [Alcaligenaceae bacterium]